jgi:hypothetical protein
MDAHPMNMSSERAQMLRIGRAPVLREQPRSFSEPTIPNNFGLNQSRSVILSQHSNQFTASPGLPPGFAFWWRRVHCPASALSTSLSL